MHELTVNNVERIAHDVRKQEIVFSHLAEDLIDHICCDVEYEMENGLTFTEAYARVKQKFGRRRLKEIQEETLYAIDTKYRFMKNTMKISGVTGTVLFGFAALFKIQHWKGSSLILMLANIILVLLLIPSLLTAGLRQTENKSRKAVYIFGAAGVNTFFTGFIFKIMHWPGSGFILATGLIIIFFIVLPFLH